MTSLSIIFAGSGEFGLPSIRRLAEDHRIVQVYTQPDRPAGRGRKSQPTPIAKYGVEHSLPVTPTPNINAELLPRADLMVVIAFGQKLSQPIVQAPRLSSINLHASRLPQFRGAAPINWAILSGQACTGNSVIRLADRMDSGAILGQSRLEILPAETAGELHDRLAIDGANLLARVIQELTEGRAVETPQDNSLATLAPKLSRETAQIDWSVDYEKIASRICGLSPWPGCRVRLIDANGTEAARVTLLRVAPRSGGPDTRPGRLQADGSISAAGGWIDILELQPEGKRAMTLTDFRHGHIWPVGGRVESIL